MARHSDTPRITTIDARTGQTIDDEPIPTIEDDIAKQLDDIIAEFGQSETDVTWQIVVNRAAGPYLKGNKEPYLFSCDTSDLSGVRDKLRDEYGEGTYRIRVRRNGRNHRQFDYTIEAPIKAKVEQSNDVSRALLERMDRMEMRNNEVTQQLIAANRNGAIGPALDPIALFEKFATIFAAMNGARPASGPDPMELMTKTFDMAARLVDLRGDNDRGGNETNVFDILKEAVKNPDLVSAFANNAQRQQNAPRLPMRRQFPAGQIQPGPIPQQDTPQPIARTQSPAVEIVQANTSDLMIAIPYLNTRAAKGAPVDFYCDWVFDNVEQSMIDAMINDPHILDALAQQFPGMVPYRSWYERLLAEMKMAAQDMLDADAPQDAETVSRQGFAERAGGATAAPQEPARHAPANAQRRSDVLDTLTGRFRDISDVADNGATGETR